MDWTVQPDGELCEPCHQEGRVTLAAYRYCPEENTLQGPALGDPDFWAPQTWKTLCDDHFQQMPPDCCLDYVPVDSNDGIF